MAWPTMLATLDGFETVYDVRHGTVQDHIGSVVEVPVLEHPGEFELARIPLQQTVIPSAFRPVVFYRCTFFFDDFLFRCDVLVFHVDYSSYPNFLSSFLFSLQSGSVLT